MATKTLQLTKTPEGLELPIVAKPLEIGAGVVALGELKLHCAAGSLDVELAGQHCELWQVAVVELAPTELRVLFIKGYGPKVGGKKLGAVRVAMKPTGAQLRRIKSMLRGAAGDKLES